MKSFSFIFDFHKKFFYICRDRSGFSRDQDHFDHERVSILDKDIKLVSSLKKRSQRENLSFVQTFIWLREKKREKSYIKYYILYAWMFIF